MKNLLIVCLVLCLFLTSCSAVFLRGADGNIPAKESSTEAPQESETEAKTEEKTEKATETPTEMPTEDEEDAAPRENRIGFYDEVTAAGVYTRLREFVSPWTAGVDIGCFDILLSGEAALIGDDYKTLWQDTAEGAGLTEAKIYLALEYTLTNGEKVTFDISDYSGAEKAIAAGYVEIYLYDDVHQVDGMWYSHLTADTTGDDTVVSSVKVTAGEKVGEVDSITLTARVENSLDGVIKLFREE